MLLLLLSSSTDEAGRRGGPAAGAVFSLNVPSGLSATDLALRNSANAGGQLVLPPPYSEQDPLSSPSTTPPSERGSGSSSCDVEGGDLPPPYADVVKDSVIVTATEEADT